MKSVERLISLFWRSCVRSCSWKPKRIAPQEQICTALYRFGDQAPWFKSQATKAVYDQQQCTTNFPENITGHFPMHKQGPFEPGLIARPSTEQPTLLSYIDQRRATVVLPYPGFKLTFDDDK